MDSNGLDPVLATAPVALARVATAGSVDDGKSTLIGRLLYETKSIYEDHYREVERASRDRGADYVNLALLTDGLRAEREQGITIDVAYRYFSTPRRSFILADTPGHVQYTRNMVTGASTADAALILVDAQHGVTAQSRRHALIAGLMHVRHIIVCVNKMDLVDYSSAVFDQVEAEVVDCCRRFGAAEVTAIPISALDGDNVVDPSARMAWYRGPTVLRSLETMALGTGAAGRPWRLPVQWINRPMTQDQPDYRGYAGHLTDGRLAVGEPVIVLPVGLESRVRSILTSDGFVETVDGPRGVTVTLDDQIDVSRGDVLCSPSARPLVGQTLEATVCWLNATPLRPGGRYLLRQMTRSVRAQVTALRERLDLESLAPDAAATTLDLNDIGRLGIRTTTPVCYEPYAVNRETGSFVLIDEATNATVAAGTITGPGTAESESSWDI